MAIFELKTPLFKPHDLARLAQIFQAVSRDVSIADRLMILARQQAQNGR
jgi:hypothetical protein